jgi:hypothetical protein
MIDIFVFGSNLAGIHRAGSALAAKTYYGARLGKGAGMQGDSYAIPTKDKKLNVLPLEVIKIYVDEFIQFAKDCPEYTFNIVSIGCGLAGYKPEQIAPMFKDCPRNCKLSGEFIEILYKKDDG